MFYFTFSLTTVELKAALYRLQCNKICFSEQKNYSEVPFNVIIWQTWLMSTHMWLNMLIQSHHWRHRKYNLTKSKCFILWTQLKLTILKLHKLILSGCGSRNPQNLQQTPQIPGVQQPQQKRHLMPRLCLLLYSVCRKHKRHEHRVHLQQHHCSLYSPALTNTFI